MSVTQPPEISWLPNWPPDWPEIRQSVENCISRGDWGRYQGKSTEELRLRLLKLTGADHCRLCSSGSVGVELALLSAGLVSETTDDESPASIGVAMCGYDYPGNFRAVELAGGRPVLLDAGPHDCSLSAEALAALPKDQVAVVLVSHLYGLPADMESIRQICDEKEWFLIEDACQTPGMRIGDQMSGTWGDVGVYSFGGSKPLTAGNGGALFFRDEAIQARLAARIDRPSDAFPMSELQAAALIPQLNRLSECNRQRSENAHRVVEALHLRTESDDQIEVIAFELPDPSTIYKLAFLSERRDELLKIWSAKGLPVGEGYRSMHRSSDRRCSKVGELSRCQELEKSLVLLDHAALLTENPDRLLRAFSSF